MFFDIGWDTKNSLCAVLSLRVHVRRLLLPVRYAVRPSVVRVTRTGVAPRHVTHKRRNVPISHFCLQLKVGSIYVNLIFITLLMVRLGFEPIRTAPSPHRATLLDPESYGSGYQSDHDITLEILRMIFLFGTNSSYPFSNLRYFTPTGE